MNHWTNALGWTLVHFVWQGALLGCATAVLLAFMRNARPEQRYTVASTALLACLAWPAFELAARLVQPAEVATLLDMGGKRIAGARPAENTFAFIGEHLLTVVALWAACAIALALRMAAGLLWVQRTARGKQGDAAWQARVERMATEMGITRAVRVRVVTQLASPLTTGWWRPVVLLPAALVTGMSPHLLEALVAHELAHVRRFDYLVNLGQNVVELLLFYHPAVWWISGRIRAERELVADDIAAGHLGEPRTLALALSALEKMQFSGERMAIAASGGDLVARIRRLVRPDAQAMNWKAALPVLGLAAVCLTLQACAAHETQKADVPPFALFSSCAKPVWPRESLANGDTGTVRLEFLISASGDVIDSRINKSSGHPPLDEAARSGIALCKFKPGTRAGQPVQTWTHVQYVWTLN
jgi:bla regulator protein BlaR1